MVTIMIPTTIGGLAYLADLFPALSQEAKLTNSEILVVDNGSKDGTPGYLANYDCTVIINKFNLGFSKAHNQMAKIAQGDYLLLLNNDTVITPGIIGEMLNTFQADPKIGMVGCLLLTRYTNEVLHAGVMFNENYIPFELGPNVSGISEKILRSDPRVTSVREVPSVTFACVLIKRECWDEVGGLDEGYINGWEDTDFVLKAKMKGWKVWYTGKTKVLHVKHGTSSRMGHESENRARFDQIWVHSGKAKEIIGERRQL